MTTNANSFVKQPVPPNMKEVLDEHKRDIEASFNCVQIGELDSFDPATQSAKVKLMIKKIAAINPDGTRLYRQIPLLASVPVIFPFGGASFVNVPIQAGDSCAVFFCDRDIDNWYVNGGSQPPNSLRAHDLSDAICIVGVKNLQNSITNWLANGIRIFFSGNSNMDFTDDQIKSIANLFLHQGNMEITENLLVHQNLTVLGNTYGDGTGGGGGNMKLYANILQQPGYEIHDGRGVSGSFERVTVEDGIVIGGS